MGGQVASLALNLDPIILVMEHALEFVEIFVYLFNDLTLGGSTRPCIGVTRLDRRAEGLFCERRPRLEEVHL